MLEPVRTIKYCSCIPQTEKLPLADGIKIKYGCALSIADGKLNAYCGQGMPDYVSAQKTPGEDGYLNVFAVDTDTEYRVRIIDTEGADVGARVKLVCRDGIYDCVTPDENGNAIITAGANFGFTTIKFTN